MLYKMIFMLLFFITTLKSVEINKEVISILDKPGARIWSIAAGNDKTYVLSNINENNPNGKFKEARIAEYDGTNWKLIDTKISGEFFTTVLQVSKISDIQIDKLGRIVVSGFGIYRQNGDNWDWFEIKDEFQFIREYLFFTIDIYNNIWFTTSIFDKEKNVKKSELYRISSATKEVELIFET